MSAVRRVLWESVETIVIALALALLIRVFLVESFMVQGQSMEPTLHTGERLLVNKLTYRFRDPRPGEIIVFRYPVNPSRRFIKRVIAVAGDSVEIRDGQVFINGVPLRENYIRRDGGDFPLLEIPEGHIFVLGDNRTDSQDSRFFGAIPISNVTGKAMFRYWPLPRMQAIN